MVKKVEGDLLAGDLKFAVVVSRFNDFITSKLLEGAIDVVVRHGGKEERVTVAYVPGSAELAVAALKLAKSGKFDAVVCLGCVIRGATDHYDHVAQLASRGIGEVGLQTGVPTIFGVVTADSLEQAIERAGSKQGNQGAKAMLAAVEMANLMKKL
ncbi:MAG: 6,7-dimethyl-8-ribityllumazine synthase [Phycisphaeraceae bacterium]|nr:6,7-dimethyl-8-ribityllumazine synthase [Phycisphaeraceae bacterium]